MRRRTVRAATRVALFTVVCLAFVFVLVTVFGQFRFDTRASYSAVFSNVSGLKGGNFVRIAGVEVGKVKGLKLRKDGTVNVDFAIDRGLTLTEGHQGGGALRKPHRRPLSVARRRRWFNAEVVTRNHDSVGADFSRTRRRRSHRRLPAAVPGVGSRSGQRTVRPIAQGVPGPGRPPSRRCLARRLH